MFTQLLTKSLYQGISNVRLWFGIKQIIILAPKIAFVKLIGFTLLSGVTDELSKGLNEHY